MTGGTGVFGTHAVSGLSDRGHSVVVLSRRSAPEVPHGVLTVRGDLESGRGIDDAVQGVDAIVHAASNTKRGMGRGDVEATRMLCEAAKAAGVANLFFISIVGIEKIPLAYYRAKLACEQVIVRAGIPYTIFRATQFHELLSTALLRAERWPILPAPLGFRFQPVAARDAAGQAAELVGEGALGRTPDFGGPQVMTVREIVGIWRIVRGVRLRTLNVPLLGRTARAFRLGLNTCPDRARGHRTWEQHVRELSRT